MNRGSFTLRGPQVQPPIELGIPARSMPRRHTAFFQIRWADMCCSAPSISHSWSMKWYRTILMPAPQALMGRSRNTRNRTSTALVESVLMMAIAYDEPWLAGDPAQSMVPGPGHPNLGFGGFLKLSWGARIRSVGISIYDIRPTYR